LPPRIDRCATTLTPGGSEADLYYRLNVVPITIPPLRERLEDIPALAKHFLRKHEPKSQCVFSRYLPSLPGNFKSTIGRATCANWRILFGALWRFSSGTVLPAQPVEENSQARRADGRDALRSGVTLQSMERQLLEKTLEATGGNRTRTAELMGLSLRTVRNKNPRVRLARLEASMSWMKHRAHCAAGALPGR